MSIFIELLLIIVLLLQKRRNKGYLLLVLILVASLGMAPFVAHNVQFSSLLTLFNLIFVSINLYLIISPWRFANFNSIQVNSRQLLRFTKILSIILICTLVINLVVFAIVLIFIPDISQFKNEKAFQTLYESIPYFSIVFRYTATSQYLGYLAIPISSYYLYIKDNKKALKFFLLSLSSVTSALALYSRAGILTFVLTCVGFYLLTFSLYPDNIQKKLFKYVKRAVIVIACIFITITIVRFSAMSYYEDRIPQESLIKDPVVYNIFDYASQGFPNGINQLELHDSKDVMYGESTLYNINQILSYFGIINWSSERATAIFQKTWNKQGLDTENDSGAFHGYTCTLIKDFGYSITLIINFLYFLYVTRKCTSKHINLDSMFLLVFLFIQPCVAIFYASYGELIFPLLVYYIVKKISFKKISFKISTK